MNILIISSNNTGCGHKSIAEALMEEFGEIPDTNVKVIEGFDTKGILLNTVGKSYGFCTRRARVLWKAVWNISLRKPELLSKFTETAMTKNFTKVLDQEKPDLILSIHPNFNAPVLNILYKNGYNIPFITLIADLISITPLWVDKRADYIISPTMEARKKCIEFGANPLKVKVDKFPVRSRFYNNNTRKIPIINNDPKNALKFLLMSGGEGVGNLGNIAEILLENFNCDVKIVAGKNSILKNKLENKYSQKYGDRLEVYGYVNNINKLMEEVDILITRGSPNVLMEAVASNLPIIVTGELLGQEEENSYYIEQKKLGMVCKDYKNLNNSVKRLLNQNGKLLKEIMEAQRLYRDPDATKNTVDFIMKVLMDFKLHADMEKNTLEKLI
ncbi:processive diacylglycerol beta-glucosyltransferase [Clostridium pasteurianum DSM 525 = ATCC 6013]|uniref:Monogalactosyldiacylglycerol synthase n=1 Tax=Clostridium pasteurianum DSM 525 = ATCC 6013 TaxID=1262449 RepID=A0A0H3JA98_CLOPA|nr:glycosyltransferase [Clostridium pasteurianum]AJA49363.1 processive diacylglycerol beta-glucosyltransferase [Clostridium pasteurianum DSM 525 = ATCC 6013]AJA53351.1 processive diacylglycerol beta-glucosyltransferase [Clostridium pasteurianum DSM 525 = ATCC 6013]AOZ76536.1 galactosyldiacylglycerol synthase [Clostridium pasteurianum DSM 525 = ATCC 6013]AOZ80333.1 galactosyldiacylglycerol synthase [Clostridium pasteurianum]ELP58383.1 monogalactosyldiacylglycerol synthase [Clostridium pasteuria